MMVLPALREAAQHVLWFNGDPRGIEPGSFTSKLLEAWAHADQTNSTLLGIAFPELGAAVKVSREVGSDALAEWAELPPLERAN